MTITTVRKRMAYVAVVALASPLFGAGVLGTGTAYAGGPTYSCTNGTSLATVYSHHDAATLESQGYTCEVVSGGGSGKGKR